MKKWLLEHKKPILLSTLLTLVPTLIGCILWDRLPETMAIHWGAEGQPDGVGTKLVAVFLLPAILAIFNLLCMIITAADPKQNGQNKKALRIVFWIMPVLSVVVCCTIYALSIGATFNMVMILPVLLGVLLLVIGNYMPKVTQNASLGIKIYWTLHNEENWNKTHRFAGKVWAICGVIMMLGAFLPLKWMIVATFVCVLAVGIIPMLYSYSIYKVHKAQGIKYTALPEDSANRKAKIISLIVVPLILIGVAVLMVTGDITYTIGEDSLQIEATYDSGLTVSYGEIDGIELRDDFDIGMRVFGFNSARLSLGAFQNEGLNNYTVYAYNACDSMILIQSKDKYLVLNRETPEETRELYEALLEKLSK